MAHSRGSTALLFGGQASPLEGQREMVERHAPELLALAERLTGADPFAEADASTRFAQPAIYCAGIARWIAAGRPGADYLAGHSLGEITALSVAGSWSLEDGLRVVSARGWLMDEASAPGDGMLALRADPDKAREIADAAGLAHANDNSPGQQILSGPSERLDRAAEIAAEHGTRAMRLPVSGAFHSAAMATAAEPFAEILEQLPPRAPRVPVLSSASGEPFGAEIAAGLTAALTRPVRWRELCERLQALGVVRYREAGPGKVLTGLVRRTLPDADVARLEVPEEVGVHA